MAIFLANNLFGTFLTYKMVGILLRKQRVSIEVNIFIYLCYFIINSIVYYLYGDNKITLISNYLCLYIIVFIVYDEYIWKLLLVPLVLAAVGYCTEEMFWYLLMSFYKKPNTTIIGVLSNFVFCIILAFLHAHFCKGVSDLHPKHMNLLLMSLPITSIALVLALDTKNNPQLMAAGTFGIVVLNIAVFYLYEQLVNAYKKEMEQYILSQKIRQYENQMGLMRESAKRISSIRHDMKNHIIVLKHLVNDEKLREASDYLEQLGDAMETDREYAKTGNDIVDSILNYYADEAKELGADIELDLKIPVALPMEPLDISIILGNLMQNAVEALRNCKHEKKLNVTFKMEKGAIRLIIVNTYNGQPIVSNGDCLKTSKPMASEHGFGLKNVRESIKKYDGEVEYKIKGNEFEVNTFILIEKENRTEKPNRSSRIQERNLMRNSH